MPHPDDARRGEQGGAVLERAAYEDHEVEGLEDRALRDELRERNKELGFLHHATRLINLRGNPEDVLRAALELLPGAMCHPELASARLSTAALEITTAGYQHTEPSLRAEFDLVPSGKGLVEVCYAPAPAGREQPTFLEEERALLASFAQLLAAYSAGLHGAEAQERLAQAEEAEQSAMFESRAKDTFLGNVAHELRSSLHVMLGWIQLLRGGSSAPDVGARGLQILERNVALQAKLIEDLMDLSRIISGKLELDARRIDLAELVSFAADATRPAASAKQLELTAELEPVGHVMGDTQRLQQVVYNLLGNAVKFTPAGGVIHLALTRSGSHARLLVSDSGIGIDADLLPHVFDRHRQASAAKRGRSGGLGLGLPIAKHLVELHHGSITVRSNQPEPGTTFEVTLPLES